MFRFSLVSGLSLGEFRLWLLDGLRCKLWSVSDLGFGDLKDCA